MAEVVLVAEQRDEHGSGASRRLRTLGRIPAVVYGHGGRPVSVSVEARALRSALTTDAGENALIDLKVGSSRHLVIARALQRHPVRLTVSHVDFQVVRRDEVVPAEVPVHLIGEAQKTTRAGGTVEHALLVMHLHAKPGDIPSAIEVDISELEIGSTVRVHDLICPPQVSFDVEPETPVVVAHPPRGLTEEESEAEAASEETPDSSTDEASENS